MNYAIILLSFLVSTIISVLIFKKKKHKWITLLSAFILNTLIFVGTTWVLYRLDEGAQIFGFGQSVLYVLIFAIPIITWVNFVILQFVKTKEKLLN